MSTRQPTALPVGSSPARRPLFRHPWRVAIVVIGLIAVANLGILLLQKADTTPPAPVGQPTNVISVQPSPGTLVRPQTTIDVQLQTNLTGALVLDGQELPVNQLEQAVAAGEVAFRPGPGKPFSQFAPGTHSVTVEFWVAAKPRPPDPGSYSWTFRVGA
ncbi:MAG TPA: hypothetical protein VI462_03930 [Acidimicrobiia bacterium]